MTATPIYTELATEFATRRRHLRNRPRHWTPAVVDLLHRRPDLRGVVPVADVVDEIARWGA